MNSRTPAARKSQRLDKKVIEILAERSTEFFKRALAIDQIKLMFRPTLVITPPCSPILKTKVSIGDDTHRVIVWNCDGENRFTSLFHNLQAASHISIRSVWSTSNMCGLGLPTEDVLLCDKEIEQVCPFLIRSMRQSQEVLEEDC